ncbi:DegT/DnrJ/EryC1/StrS family aminotransferase [Rickettsiella endosymbiont of Aleochara curtula]|uniref:DegT/DnrJ/EryC1/StrS family aminotransferase n=1 Tax=Rickettsiella endosymbiont of Aleochara curtula TaxID=3077936 RepID=UPI00313A9815
MRKLNDWNKKRREIANRYIFEFQNLPFTFQVISSHSEHVYHLFQIKTVQRNQWLRYLISNGIDAVIRYAYPIHLQESFAYLNYQIEDFPVAENLAKNLLCLPLHPYLTEKQFLWVVSCVKDFFS